jgi:L-lactate utilization protein LutC
VSARDVILSNIRAAAVSPSAVAALVVPVGGASDLLEHFFHMLTAVGGHGIVRRADQSVVDIVTALVDGEDGDVVVVPGRFAVAENGAVYVDAADLSARADVVRAEHLVLVVPAAALVPTMHDAVRRMPSGSACGWFLSGPSKTADIEQSLVVGAQGARTLHVIFDAG